jgi:hypothetical protein
MSCHELLLNKLKNKNYHPSMPAKFNINIIIYRDILYNGSQLSVEAKYITTMLSFNCEDMHILTLKVLNTSDCILKSGNCI